MADFTHLKKEKLKATILSGFLGAGKTTLLNHIIRENHGLKIAILVNDFGEINIDSDLIESQEEYKLNLTGGCICCTMQSDLFFTVMKLLKEEKKPDYLIVECSGAADPLHVLTLLSSLRLRSHIHVDGLFTIIDASSLMEIETQEHRQLAEHQIKVANLLILNKIDRIDDQKLEKVKQFIRNIIPKAVMLETTRCQIPVDLVLGFKDLPELKSLPQHQSIDIHMHEVHQNETGLIQILPEVPVNNASVKDKPHDLVFESWSFNSDRPLNKKAFEELLEHISPDIIRAKGFVYWDDPEDPLILFNLVGKWINLDVHFEKQNLPLETRLVFIGNPGWKKQSGIESRLIHCLTAANKLN